MKMSELRKLSPELADIIQQLGPSITRGAIYIDDKLVHGTPPPVESGWVSPESYQRMQEYGNSEPPTAPKMPRTNR